MAYIILYQLRGGRTTNALTGDWRGSKLICHW